VSGFRTRHTREDERAAQRPIEHRAHTRQNRENEEVPGLNGIQCEQHGEQRAAHGHQRLRGGEGVAAVEAVRDDT
jgi:hypothetical protein